MHATRPPMPGKRKDTLTGGTNDVNPQWWRLPTLGGPNTTYSSSLPSGSAYGVEQSFPIPVQRLAQAQGRAQVMEILKIRYQFNSEMPLTNSTTQGTVLTVANIATSASGNQTVPGSYRLGDPHVIDFDQQDQVWYRVPGGGIYYLVDGINPEIHDLTDGDGHGVLVATDNIFVGWVVLVSDTGSTDGFPVFANSLNVDILYRWKEVSLAEYIGIVQSQQ